MPRFEDLLRQEPSVRSYLLSLVGRVDVAEDLLQETYLKAVRALDAEEIRSPRAWLQRVAYRVAVDYQRSRAADPTARAREIYDLADPEAREPGFELLVREETERVCRAIDQLPPMQRALLRGHYLEGAGYEELSRRLYVSRTGAKVAAFRARRRVRERLDGDP